MQTFHHLGLVTDSEKPGETYYPDLKVWGIDPEADPNWVEWARFHPDNSLADKPMAKMSHVSYASYSLRDIA